VTQPKQCKKTSPTQRHHNPAELAHWVETASHQDTFHQQQAVVLQVQVRGQHHGRRVAEQPAEEEGHAQYATCRETHTLDMDMMMTTMTMNSRTSLLEARSRA
jgi:hypothetical protein